MKCVLDCRAMANLRLNKDLAKDLWRSERHKLLA